MNKNITNEIDKIRSILIENICQKQTYGPGLLTDMGGTCMFLFYHSRVFNNEESYDLAYDLLERIMMLSPHLEHTKQYTYSSGLAGLGWLINHLEINDFVDFEDLDALADVDRGLSSCMSSYIGEGNYDFLHGSMGIFYYYLQKPLGRNQLKLEEGYSLIDSSKKIHENGFYWDSYNALEKIVEIGTANLGISHGIPSILSLVCKYHKVHPQESTVNFITKTTDFLLSSQNSPGQNSLFPYTYSVDKPQDQNSRLGWCYGDLGIALSVWAAGKALENSLYKEKAIKILEHSIDRKEYKENQIVDAGLCHGTAGIAQIYRRFFIETGNELFQHSAEFWTDETLKLLNGRTDVTTRMVKWDNKRGYVNCFGLLEGISGVGLALLSSVSDKPLSWDETLLIN